MFGYIMEQLEMISVEVSDFKMMVLQIMALVADFMLVWLPAPTVSLKPPLAVSAGPIAKFLYSCPDNAFQVVSYYFHLTLFLNLSHGCLYIIFFSNLLYQGCAAWNFILVFAKTWSYYGIVILLFNFFLLLNLILFFLSLNYNLMLIFSLFV